MLELHQQLSALANQLRSASQPPAAIGEALRQVEAAVQLLPAEVQSELRRKMGTLEMMVENHQRWPALRRLGSPISASALRVAPGQHSRCEDALTNVWDVRTDLPPAGEIWLRVAAPTGPNWTRVDTGGSDFDTTIEVWSDCPNRGGQSLATADDELGLQAQIAIEVEPGKPVYVRFAGWRGDAGSFAATVEGSTGGISGRVVREDTLAGVPDVLVVVWAPSGLLLKVTTTDASGNYVVDLLTAGSYKLTTRAFPNPAGLLEELYPDVPCPGGPPSGCDLGLGTAVPVAAGEVTTAVDFTLGSGGRIAGRIVDAETQQPLAGLKVSGYNASGGFILEVTTDQVGRYLLAGLAGDVFVTATGSSLHQSEVYDDVHCLTFCTPTTGTPVETTLGSTILGIDFALERRGTITGHVTQSENGAPLPNAVLTLYSAQGSFVRSVGTDLLGEYVLGGLDAGDYYVTAQSPGYIDEVWEDQPCSTACVPLDGDPVSVALDATTSGVDFALERLGSISGFVTDAQTGEPVPFGTVYGFDAAGAQFAASVSSGNYLLAGLRPGPFQVFVNGYRYRGMLYDGIDCPGGPPTGCLLSSGTEVLVAPDTTTAGINFDLQPLGLLSGTVVATGSAEPITSYRVAVWTLDQQYVTASHFGTTTWQLEGINPGEYYVSVTHPDYLDELFDDLPCPGGHPAVCDPGGLAPSVAATSGTTTTGIDFELEPMGSIAGMLTSASDGQPVYGKVEAFDSAGALAGTIWAQGPYRIGGLDTGDYTVKASGSGLSAILFDAVPCPPGCDVTSGTVVPVVMGATTAGIDLAVPPDGSISGFVGATVGQPPSGVWLTAYTPSGEAHASWWTGAGHYQVSAAAGSYFLVADPEQDHQSQLYQGIDCPTGTSCPVTTGTPVIVQPGIDTPGIDFSLEPETGIVGQVTDSQGQPIAGVVIDLWLSTGVWSRAALTDPSGRYRLAPPGGIYYLSTDNGLGAMDEVWLDVPCPLGPAYLGLCDPLDGDAVSVQYGDLVSGVDFILARVPVFADGFESGDTSAWSLP